MHAHADWLRGYSAQHAGEKPLPYHFNGGVPEDQYRRYQASPINHFFEVSRQTIRIHKKAYGTSIRLKLQGQQRMFDTLDVDSATPTVTTARDTSPLRAKIEPRPAMMPPDPHGGSASMASFASLR
jgi:hypothetical protein